MVTTQVEPGNQQERLRILPPSFIGGLATGESWFGIFVHRNRTNSAHGFAITPGFTMDMTDTALVEQVSSSLTYYGIPHNHFRSKTKQIAGIRVTGKKRLRLFLPWIIPHLAGSKLVSAQLVAEYIGHRNSLPRLSPYTEIDLDYVERSRLLSGKTVGLVCWARYAESSETIRRTPGLKTYRLVKR